MSDVHHTVITLAETMKGNYPNVIHKAFALAEQMKDFSFLVYGPTV